MATRPIFCLTPSGASRWPGGSTYCRAGSESDLLWIKLDRTLKVQALDSVHYDSCFENIGPGYALSIGSRTVKLTNSDEPTEGKVKTSRITFDLSSPEQGLSPRRS